MSDPRIKNIINHALDDNAVDVQDSLADVMLDRIRDLVDDKRAQVAAAFLGTGTPEMQAQAEAIEDALHAESVEDKDAALEGLRQHITHRATERNKKTWKPEHEVAFQMHARDVLGKGTAVFDTHDALDKVDKKKAALHPKHHEASYKD